MDSRHASGGPTRPSTAIMAVCPLGLAAAPSCAPPLEASASDEPADRAAASPVAAVAAVDHPAAAARPASASASSFTLFESGQVRPLALSPDGRHLFATNTPDNRLELFRIERHGLVHTGSIPVGLEPAAVAARSEHEVWVVNHLSDSVSVIELDDDDATGRVVRTLLVGDEPRDIVFAGPDRRRAFITTAHR